MPLQSVLEQLNPHKQREAESDVLISFRGRLSGELNSVCCNPLHKHALERPASTLYELGQQFPQQFGRMIAAMPPGLKNTKNAAECTNCLTYVSQKSLEEFCCPICFDVLDVAHHQVHRALFNAKNAKLQSFERHFASYLRPTTDRVWVTPCGHCFHENCLRKWMEENTQCPVDRQPLLAATE